MNVHQVHCGLTPLPTPIVLMVRAHLIITISWHHRADNGLCTPTHQRDHIAERKRRKGGDREHSRTSVTYQDPTDNRAHMSPTTHRTTHA